jgi:hypothetical protein
MKNATRKYVVRFRDPIKVKREYRFPDDAKTYDAQSAADLFFQLKSESMFTDCLSLDEYFVLVRKTLREFFSVNIKLRGRTESDRAADLLAKLTARGFILEIISNE